MGEGKNESDLKTCVRKKPFISLPKKTEKREIMIQPSKQFHNKELTITIRSAEKRDAKELSEVRLKIDGETEYLDREPGEALINKCGFKRLIKRDSESPRNLFLVAEVDGRIVGFSRCEGNDLKRTKHRIEFGVCILKDYWGFGIGTLFLEESISWATANRISKITLLVLESNEKAIQLYKKYGFKVEGMLKNDKILSDGKYYNTVIMGKML